MAMIPLQNVFKGHDDGPYYTFYATSGRVHADYHYASFTCSNVCDMTEWNVVEADNWSQMVHKMKRRHTTWRFK